MRTDPTLKIRMTANSAKNSARDKPKEKCATNQYAPFCTTLHKPVSLITDYKDRGRYKVNFGNARTVTWSETSIIGKAS